MAEAQGESLTSLLGDDEAKLAEKVIEEINLEVTGKVKSKIAAFQKVFSEKDEPEQARRKRESVLLAEQLCHQEHHRVECPACKSVATVQGDKYGREQIENTGDEIIVRQSVIPTKFSCKACDLTLSGYSELIVANIADHFTNRVHYTPEEFYELVDPNDREVMDSYAEDNGYYNFSND
ncbi:MAG: hypothetical protein K2X37_13540 [Chitinophagaceae bacterium]|nr:hypothetical protein [Chitinophagaceae bacterium]